MQHDQNTIDTTISAIASKATYVGSGGTAVSWLLSSEGGVFVGLAIAIAGFAVNWYYKYKQDSRESKEHEARMRELQKE